ncbi:MAG: fumarylacetoacetate hydrolase family protein [Chloroflexi bacterium]|nr:fumarylacetoacetate hydrolase family protein [Chloroflexota bacterium]
MKLSKINTPLGPRWMLDGVLLVESFTLGALLAQPAAQVAAFLHTQSDADGADGIAIAPLDAQQEIWASGVTYLRSRDARKAESSVADVYQKVYEAERPELFMKSVGWRVRADGQTVRIRADSQWNVPEPELVLVINSAGEIVGYTAGNDMSSRDIEGENPLYLPQAKIYNGSCALGSSIMLCSAAEMTKLPVTVSIERGGAEVFAGETSITRMKRTLQELADYLLRELDFPQGVLLMTGTGIVPPESFTLTAGDVVHIRVGDVTLTNAVA